MERRVLNFISPNILHGIEGNTQRLKQSNVEDLSFAFRKVFTISRQAMNALSIVGKAPILCSDETAETVDVEMSRAA